MEEKEPDLIIDSSNFHEFFFDVRRHRPKVGQILAKFSAVALFGAGMEKRDMIKILKTDKAVQAAMVMRKIHCAREPDCYRVCREMCEDMQSGMSDEAVENKDYEFVLEAFFYTKREYVPKNDPKWETIDMLEYDPDSKSFKAVIELPDVKKEDMIAK